MYFVGIKSLVLELRTASQFILKRLGYDTLREKCPNTEFFLVRTLRYSVRIQENTEQEKLRIWTFFTR